MEFKQLHKEAIPAAIEKAKQYRLLNEPSAAQSICLDILEVDPDNQEALVIIILAMTDRLTRDYSVGDSQIDTYLDKVSDEFQKAYYTGIVYERRAKAILKKGASGSEATVFELFRQAMEWFEKAESLSSEQDDNAILRYNHCLRLINANGLAPQERSHDFDFIE
jgi:DNA-directed RNA polymerase subunit F